MRRGKKAANEDVEDAAEDPQDSGEDWNPEAGDEKPSGGRGGGGKKRASKGTPAKGAKSKKAKPPPSEESEPEEEDLEDEEDDKEDTDDENDANMKDVPKYFHSGNFVLLKSDVKWNGDSISSKLKDLNIWKIDGKALLQKYVPLESNGQILHKCTCAYSGWNVDNRDNYYPISEILDMSPKTDSKEVCVALNLDDLVKVKDK